MRQRALRGSSFICSLSVPFWAAQDTLPAEPETTETVDQDSFSLTHSFIFVFLSLFLFLFSFPLCSFLFSYS